MSHVFVNILNLEICVKISGQQANVGFYILNLFGELFTQDMEPETFLKNVLVTIVV